jgi:ABC-2 type transport system permease protein
VGDEEIQMRAIYILWQRQLKRFYRSKTRIIAGLGQPLLFLIALGLGFGPIFSKAGEGNYIIFLTPGIMAMSILFTSLFNGIEVIWDRQFGFLKETLVAPVSRLSIMLGKTLGGATVALIQGTIVMFLSMIVGFRPESLSSVIFGLVFMATIAILFTSIGIAVASKMQDMHGFQLIMNFLVMPTFFLSGALFPLENLPLSLTLVTRINPLTYGVDGLRGVLTGSHHFPLLLDFSVTFLFALIVLAIGSYLFSKAEA